FAVVQSVDSVELLQKLDAAADESQRALELLIQVDLAHEATKFGAHPDEVSRILEAASGCRAARVVGLMTLPPAPDSPEDSRPWFQRLRAMRDEWVSSGIPVSMLAELSMGMSG